MNLAVHTESARARASWPRRRTATLRRLESRPGYWRAFCLLALFGAMTAFVTSAMAAHLPGLLLAVGTTTVAALTAAALLGPAQVAARLGEFLAARRFRFHPLADARASPPRATRSPGIVLAIFGGPAAARRSSRCCTARATA